MKFNFYKSISTCFGLGYISPLPGTLTSFFTVIIIWTVQKHLTLEATILLILFATLIGYISVEKNPDKVSDPKEIVIDEFIGQSLVLVFLPLTYQDYILGFILFRIFDICKPMPINYFEKKYPNAFGIIFDDIIAAGYSLLAIYIINNII
jgi:phosphatidylglycerophosphatase A